MAKIINNIDRAGAKVLPRTWTPNQVVAHNLARARTLRGWTQEEAAKALAPYLGTRLSVASFSAIERSIVGTRVKQFTADELVAMSRAFDVPLGWWFTPPSDGSLYTPDNKRVGIDFTELADIVLGIPDTLPPWIEALDQWAGEHAQASSHLQPDPASRTAVLAEQRARALVRERLGDLGEARDVLRRLADLLERLDDAASSDDHSRPPGHQSPEVQPAAASNELATVARPVRTKKRSAAEVPRAAGGTRSGRSRL